MMLQDSSGADQDGLTYDTIQLKKKLKPVRSRAE